MIDQVIKAMIPVSEQEMDSFLLRTEHRICKKHEIISRPGQVPHEVFFVQSGLLRTSITDPSGLEHTIHFALEGQFIADYSGFMLRSPCMYQLQAIEDTELTVLSRSMVEWGYGHLQYGDRLGRLIAEYYFVYHDHHLRNIYSRTPKERYDSITDIFPDIHNRVPQHMIASFLGITPVHLSRLKRKDRKKI